MPSPLNTPTSENFPNSFFDNPLDQFDDPKTAIDCNRFHRFHQHHKHTNNSSGNNSINNGSGNDRHHHRQWTIDGCNRLSTDCDFLPDKPQDNGAKKLELFSITKPCPNTDGVDDVVQNSCANVPGDGSSQATNTNATETVANNETIPSEPLQHNNSIKYRRARLNLNLLPLGNLGGNSTSNANTTSSTVDSSRSNSNFRFSIPISGNAYSPTGGTNSSGRKRFSLICYLNNNKSLNPIDTVRIDTTIPLEKQGWFHGFISRTDAEELLQSAQVGSYLVRKCDQWKRTFSLSLKSIRGYMHIRIYRNNETGQYTLGTSCLEHFDSIPLLIDHFTSNRLPIPGAEHMSLVCPVIDQLL